MPDERPSMKRITNIFRGCKEKEVLKKSIFKGSYINSGLILSKQLSELKKSDSRQKSWQIAGLFVRFSTQKVAFLNAWMPFMNY